MGVGGANLSGMDRGMNENPYRSPSESSTPTPAPSGLSDNQLAAIFFVLSAMGCLWLFMTFPPQAWNTKTLSRLGWQLCAIVGFFISGWGSKAGKKWQLLAGIIVASIGMVIRQIGVFAPEG